MKTKKRGITRVFLSSIGVGVGVLLAVTAALAGSVGNTTRISIANDGAQAETRGAPFTESPAISADGQSVAFSTDAATLVAGDTNGVRDVLMRKNGVTTRESVASDGRQVGRASLRPSLSGDGACVSFSSIDPDLVPGDTNRVSDIFLRCQGTITRVSVATNSTQADSSSTFSSISADGRYIAFDSFATNLVSGDTNNATDVFVRDTESGTTTRVSVASDGTQGNGSSSNPSISGDGRYVAFQSGATNLVGADTNAALDVFVYDLESHTITRDSVATDGSEGNDASAYATISANGQLVSFESAATNLVGGDSNNAKDAFVRDRQTSTTSRVSVASNGAQGNHDSLRPSVSGDGRYVSFWSDAWNLVAGDNNGWSDAFVRDRQTSTTTRISVAGNGAEQNGPLASNTSVPISGDGRYVAFGSYASNLVAGDANNGLDIFVRDRQAGTTVRATVSTEGAEAWGAYTSYSGSLSADGRYAGFESEASNLVPGDTNGLNDVFVRDRQAGTTARASVASDGSQANSSSYDARLSTDGRFVAFDSYATNLVVGDSNNTSDVFLRDTQTSSTTRVSVANDGAEANSVSYWPLVSGDGRYVAFYSLASNLVAGDSNGTWDVFVRDRQTSTTTRVSVASDGTQANDQSFADLRQSRRALRRFLLVRIEPRPRRYERLARRLRQGPPSLDDHEGQSGERWRPGEWRQFRGCSERRWPLRRV
jgi:hypothetical protein